jgi:hypothetical protein
MTMYAESSGAMLADIFTITMRRDAVRRAGKVRTFSGTPKQACANLRRVVV